MGILFIYIVLIDVNNVVVRFIFFFIRIGWVKVVINSIVNVNMFFVIVLSVRKGIRFLKVVFVYEG